MNAFVEDVIAQSIDYLVAHYQDQPDLEMLARRAGYEPTHFQKIFRQKVGISPKRLVQYMSFRHARDLLADGHTTEEAASAAGLSGTGRLYDLFVSCSALTPGEAGRQAKDIVVTYGYHPTPLGEILIGQTDKGVCFLGFLMDEDRTVPLHRMKHYLPLATYREDTAATRAAAQAILTIWAGHGDAAHKLKLDLQGTNFQIQVWQALLKIPLGETVTYQDIAQTIGRPKSMRAVGNAVGANPVSLLIPCHRVIRSTGIIDNYGWGSPRKKAILAVESALCPPEEFRLKA
jgi:AraC family transcriptional regulator of adaptative response/methylated-DNA-[protein]-cysteine methyltransferase